MTGLFAPTIATPNNPRRTLSSLAIVRFILLAGIFVAALLFFVETTQATVPPQTRNDVTVIGIRNRTFSIPAETSRAEVIRILRDHYGTAAPNPNRIAIRIGGQNRQLNPGQIRILVPSRINFNHKADAVLLGSRAPNARVNANRAIIRSLNTNAVNRIIERFRTDTRVQPRNTRYVYNQNTRRLEVRAGSRGRVVLRPDMRRAIHDAMVQFATQGYRGSVTTRNVPRSVKFHADVATRQQLPRVILVVRSERRLFVYDRGRIIATYRIAVGRPGNSTPRGDFLIGAKRRNPTWGNPGSAWARNMPQRIGPGPNNPLGVRALNLDRANGRPTLLRIHGTSNTGSIGRAASAGCIRLTNRDIVRLFNQIPSGTRVWIR